MSKIYNRYKQTNAYTELWVLAAKCSWCTIDQCKEVHMHYKPGKLPSFHMDFQGNWFKYVNHIHISVKKHLIYKFAITIYFININYRYSDNQDGLYKAVIMLQKSITLFIFYNRFHITTIGNVNYTTSHNI